MDFLKFIKRTYYKILYADLVNATDQTKEFSLVGLTQIAKVTSIHSGDRLNIVTRVAGRPQLFNVKMQGYESPQFGCSEVQDILAEKSKSTLEAFAKNKLVRVFFSDIDSCGIHSVRMWAISGGKCINDRMLLNRCGIPVDVHGNKKLGIFFPRK